MKIALLSDVHSNVQALEAVLADIGRHRFDKLAFLGDAVGYGGNPNQVVYRLAQECEIRILGNHDACAIGKTSLADFNVYARDALEFTASVLDDQAREILGEFQLTKSFEGLLLTHATPHNPSQWGYCLNPTQAEAQFEHLEAVACFFGHSHLPIIFERNSADTIRVQTAHDLRVEPGRKYLINVGSVGQPRDGDPRACYAWFDTEEQTLSYRRVPYDIEAAQAVMKQHRLPEFLIERLARGR